MLQGGGQTTRPAKFSIASKLQITNTHRSLLTPTSFLLRGILYPHFQTGLEPQSSNTMRGFSSRGVALTSVMRLHPSVSASEKSDGVLNGPVVSRCRKLVLTVHQSCTTPLLPVNCQRHHPAVFKSQQYGPSWPSECNLFTEDMTDVDVPFWNSSRGVKGGNG